MNAAPALRPIRIDAESLALEPLVLDPSGFQSPLPEQHYCVIFADDAIGLAVGVWDTTTMQEAFGPYPGDEFITVLDGSFAIVDGAGAAVAGHAGQSATFRNGIPVSWKQDGYLRKIYLTLLDPRRSTPRIASAKDGVRTIDPARVPQGRPDADGILREVVFCNDARTMTVALVTYPAMKLVSDQSATHQLIRVLQGGITLNAPDGHRDSFGPGAHFFVQSGVVCAWSMVADTVAIIVDVTPN